MKKKDGIEELVEHPAFKAAMGILDSMGPIVPNNPKMDKAYKTLRLLGLSQEDTVEVINKFVSSPTQ